MLNWLSLKFRRKSHRAVEHDEVAERDAGDEQDGHHQQERQRDAALAAG